jgi:branched-chain amino acid transport system ATP-binding protein
MKFGGLWALKSISFSLKSEEILGVIGSNGAGKSTLINVVSGLIKPTSGRVFLAEKEITGRRPHEVSKLGVARTFQIVRPFMNLTVFDNIMVAALHNSSGTTAFGETESITADCMKFVGLAQKRDQIASSLNEVEKRRLELARALATKPKILLLDEIAAGSSPEDTKDTVRIIRELRDSWDLSICMVEHVMKVIMNVSDRVIVLDQGEVIAEGTPGAVAKDLKVIEAYLGS